MVIHELALQLSVYSLLQDWILKLREEKVAIVNELENVWFWDLKPQNNKFLSNST